MWPWRSGEKAALAGVLGINRRNLDYVYCGDGKRRFPLVDDKILAKRILLEAGLSVPDSIAEVASRSDIRSTLAALAAQARFVIKPARGFGGAGVKVYRDHEPFGMQGHDRHEEFEFHMAAILAGMYAMDALADRVLVEAFVEETTELRQLHGDTGVSDLRIIVRDGTPVMAMLRLPCRDSSPTANLHRGGIGVGVNVDTGITTFAIQRGAPLSTHPDTGLALTGFRIPLWPAILAMALPLNRAFDIRYLGADLVIDTRRGPLILEVNARPGLAIQLANRRGLLSALQAIGADDRRE